MFVTAFPPSFSLFQYLPGLPRTLELCMLPISLLTMSSAQVCQPLPPQLSALHCLLCNHALRFLPGTVSVYWQLFRLFPVFRKSFLPVLTLYYERPARSVGVMYISPLKALINDQFKRLEQMLLDSNIPVTKWHGDASVDKKGPSDQASGGNPADHAGIPGKSDYQ